MTIVATVSRRVLLSLLLVPGCCLFSQDSDTVKVPLTDPSRPVRLKASLLNGSLTIKGYDGKEVIVENGPTKSSESGRVPEKARGLRRIDLNRSGLTVEEQDNEVLVKAGPQSEPNIVIQVPRRSDLHLRLVNGGGITVEGIEGEIDADVTNGFLTMKGISGSAVAHALNDDVIATFVQVAEGKPMAFSSLNGDIDVTLPAQTKARLKMKTDNGEIYTDFDLKLESGGTSVEKSRSERGRYRVKIDQSVLGSINGGGPEYQFTSPNGRIFVRKK